MNLSIIEESQHAILPHMYSFFEQFKEERSHITYDQRNRVHELTPRSKGSGMHGQKYRRARAKVEKSASIGSKGRKHKHRRARAQAAKRVGKASDGREQRQNNNKLFACLLTLFLKNFLIFSVKIDAQKNSPYPYAQARVSDRLIKVNSLEQA